MSRRGDMQRTTALMYSGSNPALMALYMSMAEESDRAVEAGEIDDMTEAEVESTWGTAFVIAAVGVVVFLLMLGIANS